MGWIPGWESIQATGWWSGFFFWASIVSLIGLGISEVASHRYSERRDELVETQQRVEKKQHDDDRARLHLEAVKANADAESARAEIAEANARALEAKVALEKFKAPRLLTIEQGTRIADKLKAFAGTRYDAGLGPKGDPEPLYLLRGIANGLSHAGWLQVPWSGEGGETHHRSADAGHRSYHGN